MRNWDFWRSIEVPLDAQIVTIVGPNGSGKTTLLDALRTLLSLRCSGRRDYKRYVRNSTEPVAWLRGVVDNPRRKGGGLFPNPFFPLTNEKVTLFCRIKKQGGDWIRQYAVVDGEVELGPASEDQLKWLGVNEYKLILEQAGLTRAIAEVLALEQGDTDKLCEYGPKPLLDLVFQVFGDKQVLDNYQQAKSEQREAERELGELTRQLDGLAARVEQMRSRAQRYQDWRSLETEVERIERHVLPALRYLDACDSRDGYVNQYKGVRRELDARQTELESIDAELRQLQARADAAKANETHLDQQYKALFGPFQQAGSEAKSAEKLLEQRNKLKALAERESGTDAVELAEQIALLRSQQTELQARIKTAKQEREHLAEQQSALQGGSQPSEPFVRQMRAALDEAGIPHQMLTELVEVVDTDWQAAVEALLAPYRHIILLNRESDRQAAFQIGQRLRYRHFIVPEREPVPSATPGSILEILDFKGDAPAWLVRQLANVQRIKSVEAGARQAGDWITPEGYHKERRGARHIGIETRDHAFGEAARRSRVEAISRQLRDLNQQILDWEGTSLELGRQIASQQMQLAGMDAIQQLAARQDEFDAAEKMLPELRVEAQRLGGEIATLQAAKDEARKETDATKELLHRAQHEQTQLLKQVKELMTQVESRQAEQTRQIAEVERLRDELETSGMDFSTLAGLREEWGSEKNALHEIHRQRERIEHGDWERDASVLELREKMQQDFNGLERETQNRGREVERARELTDEARSAYINKLRATIRAYALNIKRLGELAGIAVEVDPPHLDNDDGVLGQAGLVVRFDFDQKGMMGLNDGEASGGQQVMKSLILLIGLMMDETNPSGFVFIDEPFAHLDVLNIDKVGAFLKATQAQYLITTPLTHNVNAFAPSELTLCTYKKRPGERWAPVISQARRRTAALARADQ
ncbi:AAA family ATPase [Parachitinimonas caeni]|uniref:AAA family ATPase n=1 Tax=Parachitinimonas caeni TaxID=3031301 RepID=A0ABT7DY87_9NEIS|nr:AAA family ATPase [Parachitinimonas caeni]MDK2125023.1 AAA family ATPase [Parachitinimonas caeni]